MRVLLAYLVHLYTASGIAFGFMSVLAIQEHQWREAMAWMFVCLFIDGTDGFLARQFQVSKYAASMDGKNIDYVIDFVTYAFIPALFVFESGLIPPAFRLWITLYILIISALYYGRKGMVTADGFFAGFPVLWNLVVFYAFFVFAFPPNWNLGFIILMGVLHFLPIKIYYPSKKIGIRSVPFILGILSIVLFVAIVYDHPNRNPVLQGGAWLVFAYFTYLTVWHTWIRK